MTIELRVHDGNELLESEELVLHPGLIAKEVLLL